MRQIMSCIALVFALMISAVQAETFNVIGEEFAPFEFEQDGEVVGIDVDIAKHIFAKLGITPKFSLYTWKRAWSLVESGEADAIFTTSRKAKREPFVIYPKEDMWVSEFVFFVNTEKKQADFNGYESAKAGNLKIGITPGNSYHDSLWAAFPYKDGSTEFKGDLGDNSAYNAQMSTAKGLLTNLKKLAAGRVDLVVVDKTVGQYTAKLNGLSDKITFYEKPLYGKGYPMPFVKNSKYPGIADIAAKYEAELKAMKASGEYQKIMDKWLK